MLTMEEAFEKSIKTFSQGEIVNGTVIEIRGKEVIVDIGSVKGEYEPIIVHSKNNKSKTEKTTAA